MRHTLSSAAAVPLCILLHCASARAADAVSGPGVGVGSLLQMLLGLTVVLAAFFGVAWLIKRSGALGTGGKQILKLVSTVAVGTRERVVVVEIGDQWIVAGVAPGCVNQLACLPRGETAVTTTAATGAPAASFAGFLKQVMEQRNAK
jgi:flagellar protein FliO/FliZ